MPIKISTQKGGYGVFFASNEPESTSNVVRTLRMHVECRTNALRICFQYESARVF